MPYAELVVTLDRLAIAGGVLLALLAGWGLLGMIAGGLAGWAWMGLIRWSVS